MTARFAASRLSAACLAATLGSAHAEGLNLRMLAPADVSAARFALAESELQTHGPAAIGAQFALSPRAALRVEYQQDPRGHALDPKPTVGELALGLQVAF